MTSPNTPSPQVLKGRRGTTARLADGALVLRSRRETRHIPLAVVERVEVAGPNERDLVVVLTAPAGSTGPSTPPEHRVTGPNSATVRAFAENLRRALPERRPGTAVARPVPEVKVERSESFWSERARALIVLGPFAAVYLAGAVALLLLPPADSEAGMPTEDAVGLWLAGPVVLALGLMCVYGVGALIWEWRVLHRRGITVEAEVSHHAQDDDGDWQTVYGFNAEDGSRHFVTKQGREEGRIDVTYDPRNPSTHWEPGLGDKIFFMLILLVVATAGCWGGGYMLFHSVGELIARS
ncbi:hypothetical protein [Streptomyces sp. NPDC056480]|uniref:hypothetical protein n=1 Tax=Streptomyces sp. NPDC056480 TaxID=3345833 RepID=UPI0036807A32